MKTEIKTFKMAVMPGYGDRRGRTKKTDIIKAIEYKGRIIIIHGNGGLSKYRASDYATGMSFGVTEDSLRKTISEAKLRIDYFETNKCDYSQYKTINP